MTNNELKETIIDNGYEDILLFESPSYTDAFIGISHDNRAIYDFDKMIECLMQEDEFDETEAIEFIEYNTLRALDYYDNAPIVLYKLNM